MAGLALGNPSPREAAENEAWFAAHFGGDYPCLLGLASHRRGEYEVGRYGVLGEGARWRELRRDLAGFLARQAATGSTHLTFWAIFEDSGGMDDAGFERALWRELSYLTSVEDRARDWPKEASFNAADPAFQFCLHGQALFVVGLHPHSSRRARSFPRPALAFNAFAQFEGLERDGRYAPMVRAIRARETSFEGSVNPMVEAHADHWESIQFSGRKNPRRWKCPFRFLHRGDKP